MPLGVEGHLSTACKLYASHSHASARVNVNIMRDGEGDDGSRAWSGGLSLESVRPMPATAAARHARAARRNTPATASAQQLCLEDDPYANANCYGGHARLGSLCQRRKRRNQSTICLDAGDVRPPLGVSCAFRDEVL